MHPMHLPPACRICKQLIQYAQGAQVSSRNGEPNRQASVAQACYMRHGSSGGIVLCLHQRQVGSNKVGVECGHSALLSACKGTDASGWRRRGNRGRDRRRWLVEEGKQGKGQTQVAGGEKKQSETTKCSFGSDTLIRVKHSPGCLWPLLRPLPCMPSRTLYRIQAMQGTALVAV